MRRELDHVYSAMMPANRLVCQVCEHTGLRVGDVLAIKTEHLRPQFWVTESKTGKRRRVNLSKDLYTRLRAQAGAVWVFESPRDPAKHRTRQAVWADIKRAAKAFRLPQNVAVHSLRKRYAVEQLNRPGSSYERVRKLLNHSSMAVTMIYAMSYQLYLNKYGKAAGE